MKLKFCVNQDYVFLHAINMAQKNEPFTGWANFTNGIWKQFPSVFYLFAGAPEYAVYSFSLSSLAKKADQILLKIKTTKQYKQLINETCEYLTFVEKQWQKNEKQALHILSEISGMSLPQKTITVFITHPKLRNGSVIDDHTIAWGHIEDFKSYTTVYLCHELTHILTRHDSSDVAHAIIELMVDNELRIRLNHKGTYFTYPGHKHLEKLKRELLPEWKIYLSRENKNIVSFIRTIKKKMG